MPKFQVLRRVDAFVDFIAEVEAESAQAASEAAGYDEEKFEWKEIETHYYDARSFVALDADGNEIESTAHGDF